MNQTKTQAPDVTTARPMTHRGNAELVSEHGRTTIADTVVAKIAGMAARQVSGVYAMGAGMSRALGAVREALTGGGGTASTQGVAVEVGERQAAADLDVIVEYGVSIPDLAAGVRRNVIDAVENMCGLEVTEVNITVDDLHLPGEETGEPQEARVR
ncbi:Asp23/Gls24 family envelope stress response protein [Sphaerisporangium sp. NPDC005288]|uniref:Asp23/Gls24 family envelope stress response protein n=1 Tax=Sphaerisporangium rhizosphaerae TaxID=2269375 RepID=A0ABW2NUU5_9ACTN